MNEPSLLRIAESLEAIQRDLHALVKHQTAPPPDPEAKAKDARYKIYSAIHDNIWGVCKERARGASIAHEALVSFLRRPARRCIEHLWHWWKTGIGDINKLEAEAQEQIERINSMALPDHIAGAGTKREAAYQVWLEKQRATGGR